MRKLLDMYYKSGKMNNQLIQELNLDKPHPILSDEDAFNDEKPIEDENIYASFGKSKLIVML